MSWRTNTNQIFEYLFLIPDFSPWKPMEPSLGVPVVTTSHGTAKSDLFLLLPGLEGDGLVHAPPHGPPRSDLTSRESGRDSSRPVSDPSSDVKNVWVGSGLNCECTTFFNCPPFSPFCRFSAPARDLQSEYHNNP